MFHIVVLYNYMNFDFESCSKCIYHRIFESDVPIKILLHIELGLFTYINLIDFDVYYKLSFGSRRMEEI